VNADMTAADGERELLRRTVEGLLAGHCTPARVAAAAAGAGWDADLWQALEETGLTLAGSPEEAGGSGGDLLAAADIAVAAGAAAAPVPLAETLAAGMLLGRAGLTIPSGPLTVAVASGLDAALGSGGRPGSGAGLRRVPYGRLATTVATGSNGSGDWLAVIVPTGRGGTGRNLAGEPRDEVIIGGDAEVHDVPAGTADYARRLLRLFRSLLIAGAAQRALDLTVTYVQEREQFGRPLARFPTVQQELARMAGEVALISAATQAAVAAEDPAAGGLAGAGRPGPGEGVSAVVAAKAQASSGAGVVAAIAHQLHGAIGTTQEHRLRLTTTRLWSWRDEDGSEAECFAELGRAALAAATGARAKSGAGAGAEAGAGEGGLWPWLSGSPGAGPAV
jgi:acyl-CoA dehydrogenase